MNDVKLLEFIKLLGQLNSSGDPHGAMDTRYTTLCREFLVRSQVLVQPLTLQQWKAYRDTSDFAVAYERNLLEAEDALTFLFILRDHLVFTSGSTDFVIEAISILIDPLTKRGLHEPNYQRASNR